MASVSVSLTDTDSDTVTDGCDHTPKKTRNPEKEPKKTLFSTKFNFICYYNPILYISLCSKHVFASLFYVNDRNTAYRVQ